MQLGVLIKARVKWKRKKNKKKKTIFSQFILFFFSHKFLSPTWTNLILTQGKARRRRERHLFYVNKQVLNDFLRAHKFTFTKS